MFKNIIADMGTIVPGQEVDLEWELLDGTKEIVHFAKDCGCTADIVQEGAKVKAVFTEQDAAKLTPKHKRDFYPEDKMAVTRGITAYFKDDHNLWIVDKDGKQVLNPKKENYKITLMGYVDLNSPVAKQEQQLTIE